VASMAAVADSTVEAAASMVEAVTEVAAGNSTPSEN